MMSLPSVERNTYYKITENHQFVWKYRTRHFPSILYIEIYSLRKKIFFLRPDLGPLTTSYNINGNPKKYKLWYCCKSSTRFHYTTKMPPNPTTFKMSCHTGSDFPPYPQHLISIFISRLTSIFQKKLFNAQFLRANDWPRFNKRVNGFVFL